MASPRRLDNFVELDPWQNAKNRFFDKLSAEDRKTFDTATIEDLEKLYYKANNAETAYQTKKLQNVIQPFMDGLKQYKDVLSVFVGTASVLRPIWGSLLVVLTIASAYEKYFEQLTAMLGKIGRNLPNLRSYEKLFQEDAQLVNHLTNAYYVILEFCIDVKVTFESNQRQETNTRRDEKAKVGKLWGKAWHKISRKSNTAC